MIAGAHRGPSELERQLSARRLPTGERILIVDDEAQMLQTLSRVLGSHGYRCRDAEGAPEGRALLGRESFDLVICDLRSAEEDVAFLDEIEQEHTETALLMVSEDLSLAHLAGEHGVSGYLVKPIREGEVLANVACALGLAKRRHGSEGERPVLQAETIERLSQLIT